MVVVVVGVKVGRLALRLRLPVVVVAMVVQGRVAGRTGSDGGSRKGRGVGGMLNLLIALILRDLGNTARFYTCQPNYRGINQVGSNHALGIRMVVVGRRDWQR